MSAENEKDKALKIMVDSIKSGAGSEDLMRGTIGKYTIDILSEGKDVTIASLIERMGSTYDPKLELSLENVRLGSAIDFLQRLNCKA